MGKYDVLLCLYPSFNLSVCNAYEGETNHSILKHTHTGLLVLPGIERQNSVIPCLGFCSPGIATHTLSACVLDRKSVV